MQKYDLVSSKNAYEKVIYINPNNIEARQKHGHIMLLMERYEDALIDYSKLMYIDKKNEDNYLGYGFALKKLGRYDQAIKIVKKGTMVAKDCCELYELLADLQRIIAAKKADDKSLLEESIKNYEKSISINREKIASYTSLQYIYQSLGELNKAEEILDSAIKNNPKSSNLYVHRAQLHLKSGNPEKAYTDAQNALRLNPKGHQEKATLAKVYINQGKKEKAKKLLTSALDNLNKQKNSIPESNKFERNNIQKEIDALSAQLSDSAIPHIIPSKNKSVYKLWQLTRNLMSPIIPPKNKSVSK